MRRSTSAAIGCAMLLASAGSARAQSLSFDKLSVNVNLGVQATSQTLTGGGTYSIYEEDASFSFNQKVDSGLLFDVSADYQVSGNFGVGLGWSFFSSDSSAPVAAEVPHPVFIGQLRSVSGSAEGLNHRASVININGSWRYPLSGKMDLVMTAGPSIVSVKQDLVTGITVQPEAPPFPPPTVESVGIGSVSKTTMGFNLGADAVYMVNRRYGAGVGLRYIFGSADIDGLDDNVKGGGLQLLFGARLRF